MKETHFSDISFEKFLSEGKLMGSRCKKCGELFTPPRTICVKCFASDMEWEEMQGTGKLIGFTCITVPPRTMLNQGYGRDKPYCSGIVELKEGTRVVARIEDVDAKNPESIRLDMPLVVKFMHQGESEKAQTQLVFRPC